MPRVVARAKSVAKGAKKPTAAAAKKGAKKSLPGKKAAPKSKAGKPAPKSKAGKPAPKKVAAKPSSKKGIPAPKKIAKKVEAAKAKSVKGQRKNWRSKFENFNFRVHGEMHLFAKIFSFLSDILFKIMFFVWNSFQNQFKFYEI